MESPSIATAVSHNSEKMGFNESSSSCVDPDVVEIAPPLHWSSRPRSKSKSRSSKKEVMMHHEVINIDMDDEPDSIVLIDEDIDLCYKGKQLASSPHSFIATSRAVHGSQSSSKNATTGAHNSLGVGFSDYDFVYGDDYLEWFQDGSKFDDEYGFLQGQFDRIDIPTGVEASIPWFSDRVQSKKPVATVDGLNYSSGTGTLHSGEKHILQTNMDTKQPYGTGLSPFSAMSNPFPKNNKADAPTSSNRFSSQIETRAASSFSTTVPQSPPGYPSRKRKSIGSGSVGNYSLHKDLGFSKAPQSYSYNLRGKSYGKDKLTYTPPVYAHKSEGLSSVPFNESYFAGDGIYKEALHAEEKLGVNGTKNLAKRPTSPSGSTSSAYEHGSEDDIMKNFQLYKQFDTVEDCSDHHYYKQGSSVKQQSKKWAKRIQEEWKILENDLPDTILVRVYESRMDLLRAVIVGAAGTPYHDGLFFFDIFFPSSYPSVPPHVYYHSGGLRINPNLYNCGKVCLSLLNTWSGHGNEKWVPNVSTMLQVLVSIQALILNEKPYFNEPGYAGLGGSAAGETSSQAYNEKTFIHSLKTMVYSMRKPPKHFKEYVIGHFCKNAQVILAACKAYIEGVEVGSLAKGGVQDVDAGTKGCSPLFKGEVANHITMLVQALQKIGAKDCDKFLSLATKGNSSQLPTNRSSYRGQVTSHQLAAPYY